MEATYQSLLEENQMKANCKQHTAGISEKDIAAFAKLISLNQSDFTSFDLFYHNLNYFYSERLKNKIQFNQITLEILKKAQIYSRNLFIALDNLLKSEFIQRLRRKLTKRNILSKVNETNSLHPNSIQKLASNQTTFDCRSISSNDSQKGSITTKVPPVKSQVSNIQANSKINPQVNDSVANIRSQQACFCGKAVSQILSSKQISFQCFHCKQKYHPQCMKRPIDSKLCSFCHLRLLIPNKQSKKTLFVGLLQKGRKRHEINLQLALEDLSNEFKIQVRCFRIKQGCQTSVLYPDSVSFFIKNSLIKDFAPLHRQSSLKYRKDEPFELVSGLHAKQNKIVVMQKHPNKESKDMRIQLQNHLLGIYLIVQKKVDRLIKQIQENSCTQFCESKALLQTHFRLNSNDGDEISFQMIKVPLICSLTLEKLKIPSRGIFCIHFQCFDLKNYLQLIVNSVNPKFTCPICKQPTYAFKIDTILNAILQMHVNNLASEVIILKNGQFKVFSNLSKECEQSIHNISDLPIDQRYRKVQLKQCSLQPLKKKIKATETV